MLLSNKTLGASWRQPCQPPQDKSIHNTHAYNIYQSIRLKQIIIILIRAQTNTMRPPHKYFAIHFTHTLRNCFICDNIIYSNRTTSYLRHSQPSHPTCKNERRTKTFKIFCIVYFIRLQSGTTRNMRRQIFDNKYFQDIN